MNGPPAFPADYLAEYYGWSTAARVLVALTSIALALVWIFVF